LSGVASATAGLDRHNPATQTAVATIRRALMRRTLSAAQNQAAALT
jgi:hypothetical protein